MKILSISFAICLVSLSALAYEPAMLRSTGELTDGYGNIIGVLNKGDPRNTQEHYYYLSIDANGNRSKDSTYVITSNPLNPLAGFVKYDLRNNEFPPKSEADSDNGTTTAPQNAIIQSGNGMVINYGQPVSNTEDINQTRYQDFKLEPVYK